MALAPIPTPKVLWRKPPVLALAALPGTALGRLGEPSTASSAAWASAGAAARMLHDAPLPPWPGRSLDELASRLDSECEWLVTNGLGGYSSGTVAGLVTRKYHGVLVAALQNPLGRMVLLNHLVDCVTLADGSDVSLGGEEWAEGQLHAAGARWPRPAPS